MVLELVPLPLGIEPSVGGVLFVESFTLPFGLEPSVDGTMVGTAGSSDGMLLRIVVVVVVVIITILAGCGVCIPLTGGNDDCLSSAGTLVTLIVSKEINTILESNTLQTRVKQQKLTKKVNK